MIELIKNNVVLQVAFVIWFGCLMYFILDIIWEKRLKEDNNEGVIHREFNLDELYKEKKAIDSFTPEARRLLVIRRPNFQARRLRNNRAGFYNRLHQKSNLIRDELHLLNEQGCERRS